MQHTLKSDRLRRAGVSPEALRKFEAQHPDGACVSVNCPSGPDWAERPIVGPSWVLAARQLLSGDGRAEFDAAWIAADRAYTESTSAAYAAYEAAFRSCPAGDDAEAKREGERIRRIAWDRYMADTAPAVAMCEAAVADPWSRAYLEA